MSTLYSTKCVITVFESWLKNITCFPYTNRNFPSYIFEMFWVDHGAKSKELIGMSKNELADFFVWKKIILERTRKGGLEWRRTTWLIFFVWKKYHGRGKKELIRMSKNDLNVFLCFFWQKNLGREDVFFPRSFIVNLLFSSNSFDQTES